ncbi:muniscin carboxy-terminal mu-like domain protein [Thalictrum thalictroides]|uniref:Muniscin carboxy-terminal mu-like domain protein n=1 Tax=Thalictrum thalictroides TaxID=46969 RepID=A0A7J6XC92_THATH|nr:muniscin carboxy-terminal mu-like domain protein [Thalictrum thalictroides]
MHGESIAKMVHSALDTENKIRGADSWSNVADMEVFSIATFEMPQQTLAAGDEIAVTLAPVQASLGEKEDQLQTKAEECSEEKDPFAASDGINKPEELVGGFKKNKDSLPSDVTGLDMTTLPPAEATQSIHIGFNSAFGGGLDPSEFVGSKKIPKVGQGLGGLELLQSGQRDSAATAASVSGNSAPGKFS